MNQERIKAPLVLALVLLVLTGVGLGRYWGARELPLVRALQRQAAQRTLYYRVDAEHSPSFALNGSERSLRLLTHRLVEQPGPGEKVDPEEKHEYWIAVRVDDAQGRLLWETSIRQESRQSQAGGEGEALAYLEVSTHRVTDLRSDDVELPEEIPPGSTVTVSVPEHDDASVVLRVYAMPGSSREATWARMSDALDAPLEELTQFRARDLLGAQVGITESPRPAFKTRRLVALDDSRGGAGVLALFVRSYAAKVEHPRVLEGAWLGGPWQRAMMIKGPGDLDVELYSEKADVEDRCPEGTLYVDQLDLHNQEERRRYVLTLRDDESRSARVCRSGRVRVQVTSELRDLRLRWEAQGAEGGEQPWSPLRVRIWNGSAPVSVLSREGWEHYEPYLEILGASTIGMGMQALGPKLRPKLSYRVQVGQGGNRELELSARRWMPQVFEQRVSRSTEPVCYRGDSAATPVCEAQIPWPQEPGELQWRFLDAQGRRLSRGTLALDAPFDRSSWAELPLLDGADGQGSEQTPSPWVVSRVDRIRLKQPWRATQLELQSSVGTLVKVSAPLTQDNEPAPLTADFAEIPVEPMQWIQAPRTQRHWLGLRPLDQDRSQAIEVRAQLHLEVKPVFERVVARWKTLEPMGRTRRQEVLMAMDSPARDCRNCWFELAPGRDYRVRAQTSLRRPAKVLMDMGAAQRSSALLGCRLELDGQALDLACPILRGSQTLGPLSPGEHQLRWVGAPQGARIWINQPSQGLAGASAPATYKRRTLHESSNEAPLVLSWSKAKATASRLMLDVYVPRDPASTPAWSLSTKYQLRRDGEEPGALKHARGTLLHKDKALHFLNDNHSGRFSTYRFVIDVGAWAAAGTYHLHFHSMLQEAQWIRAVIRQ